MNLRPVHPFPARMAPSVILDELVAVGKAPLRVLDPMSGSGTTLVVARSCGHIACGLDTDPLSLLISKAWCSDVDEDSILVAAQAVLEKANLHYRVIDDDNAYPANCDDETKQFVDYWFDVPNRKQLRALSMAIEEVADHVTRTLLWCAFSRLIIAKTRGASLAIDLPHSRPHRVDGKVPFRPIQNFLRAVRRVVDNAPFRYDENPYPQVHISLGDARLIPLPDSSVDVIITSPPYLNAIDYVRCHKFSLIWMGYRIPELRRLRAQNIGSEVSTGVRLEEAHAEALSAMGDLARLPPRRRRILARYVSDMDNVLREMARVLVGGGRAILVVGDSTMRGVYIRNSEALLLMAQQHGFVPMSVVCRDIPARRRYLPPPTSPTTGGQLQTRMAQEIVMGLRLTT